MPFICRNPLNKTHMNFFNLVFENLKLKTEVNELHKLDKMFIICVVEKSVFQKSWTEVKSPK